MNDHSNNNECLLVEAAASKSQDFWADLSDAELEARISKESGGSPAYFC
jgi:hypothetical protein